MAERKCKNCRHFETSPWGHQELCMALSESDLLDVIAADSTGNYEGNVFCPKPDFGCVLWEAKELRR